MKDQFYFLELECLCGHVIKVTDQGFFEQLLENWLLIDKKLIFSVDDIKENPQEFRAISIECSSCVSKPRAQIIFEKIS